MPPKSILINQLHLKLFPSLKYVSLNQRKSYQSYTNIFLFFKFFLIHLFLLHFDSIYDYQTNNDQYFYINKLIMFFVDRNELIDFTDRLLALEKDEQILKALKEEDEKVLLFAKNEMIQKMPKELHPEGIMRNQQVISTAFPSMFESSKKKIYEYINEDIDNMKKVALSYSLVPKLPSRAASRLEEPPLIPTEVLGESEQAKRIGTEPRQQKLEQPKSHTSVDKHQKSQRSINYSMNKSKNIQPSNNNNPFTQIKRNPFVPNNINFTDNFANSKTLQQKYQHLNFNQNSRNLTAIAHSAKYNAFSQSNSFPTSVMTGTMLPPKEKTFSRETKLDVEDVMRYTLGVKREKTNAPMENPFMRVPKRRQ